MPWKGLPTPYGLEEMALFRASTHIVLGAGKKALFWHDAWLLDGSTPRDRWPGLFAIASRKNRTVQKELTNRNWVRALLRIDTTQQINDFVTLWECIQETHLSTKNDSISWRWAPLGSYTAALAYRTQFLGLVPPFNSQKIGRPR
ncbi:hypothetical protein BRADI_1g34168v3 [Brachypodium distachyon]|uniref:Reverse transcriptase zinc-binding domain-containing protein n=1 Tax=Brachypodium distachyon TaxID=15368 RepID=A0A2K2DMM8_BRADI|nr:hypothetical protein BRADI_1g34168v3 [Brachypodium distachyon]